MAFVRLDDQIAAHPKVLRAGAEAAWLWACAIAYCNRQLTDGHVPAAALGTLGTFKTPVKRLAQTLVSVGLFDADGADYRVHDYLQHNPDKATVLQRMREAADRKAHYRGRKGQRDTTGPGRTGDADVPVGHARDNDETGASSRAHVPTPTPTPSSYDDYAQARESSESSSMSELTAGQLRTGVLELLALWTQYGTGAKTPVFEKLTPKEKRDLRDALRARSVAEWEAVFRLAKASDYLAGRDGQHDPMSLWDVMSRASRIEDGEYRNRTKPAAPVVGIAPQDRPSAEVLAARDAIPDDPHPPYLDLDKIAAEADALRATPIKPLFGDRAFLKGGAPYRKASA